MELVFSTFRTASTYYCKKLAEKTGYLNLDEFFHPMYVQPGSEVDYTSYSPKDWRNRYYRLHNTYGSNCVVKIMTTQLPEFDGLGIVPTKELNALLELSPNLHFVVRKDFKAQCNSFIAAINSGIGWHEEWEGTKEIDIDTNNNQSRWLKMNNIYLARLYHYVSSLPNMNVTLSYTEDFAKTPYINRKYKFTKEVKIEKLDIVKLFSDATYTEDCYKRKIWNIQDE